MVDVRTQNEVEVIAILHLFSQRSMTREGSTRNKTLAIQRRIIQHTQVEETLQLTGTICSIIDINLRVTLQTLQVRNIHIVVVFLILYHLLQIVVVGHLHLYMVRVRLTTDVRQSVVGQTVAVLIPIERIGIWCVRNTIGMTLSIRHTLEQLPATTSYLRSTWNDIRFTQTQHIARDDHRQLINIGYGRTTTLERNMDVHHMALCDRSDMQS